LPCAVVVWGRRKLVKRKKQRYGLSVPLHAVHRAWHRLPPCPASLMCRPVLAQAVVGGFGWVDLGGVVNVRATPTWWSYFAPAHRTERRCQRRTRDAEFPPHPPTQTVLRCERLPNKKKNRHTFFFQFGAMRVTKLSSWVTKSQSLPAFSVGAWATLNPNQKIKPTVSNPVLNLGKKSKHEHTIMAALLSFFLCLPFLFFLACSANFRFKYRKLHIQAKK